MRIVFACAFLNEQGGFENHVHANADLALQVGHSVAIYTPSPVPENSTIRALQARVRFDSAEETWRRTFPGKVMYGSSWLKHCVTHLRSPDPFERVSLARSRKPAGYLESFWARNSGILAGADLVHTFGKPKPFVVQAIRSAHALRIPVIYEELAQVSEDYAARPDHRDFSRCSNLCTRIVTLAQRNTDDIRRWFGFEGDAEVIDQWAFFDEDRLLRRIPRAHTRPGEIVFGSLSRLGHEKGLPSLVRAFAEVYRTMPGVRLRIAGQGPLEPQLRSLVAELLPEGVVEFLRYIPDRAEFFDSIDVFVIASQEEGGPITGVEAMSAGMPIITTPVGAMPERLSVNSEALFVRTNEVNELHPAMLRVASDTGLRISLSEAAKSRYLARNHSSVQAERKRVLWDTVRLPVAVSHC